MFSLTIAIEIVFSGSKCHFGPSNVQVADQHGAPQNPAAAVLVYANPNLNCGFPAPTPLDLVIAPNTATLSMTWGDILAGIMTMAIDIVLQTAINLICYFGTGKLFNWIGRKVAPRAGARALVLVEPDLWRVTLTWCGFTRALRPYMFEELGRMPFAAQW